MAFLDRIRAARDGDSRDEKRFSVDQWLSDYLMPSAFGYNGTSYNVGNPLNLVQTLAGNRASEILATLPGYAAALRNCPPAFAAEMVRALVLSQVRFTWRNRPSNQSTPRRLFGTRELDILERPWPRATTGDLVARMEWHAGLAGNAYVYRQPKRLRVLRPDWVAIVYGSQQEPEDAASALDGDVIGYVFQNGGLVGSYGGDYGRAGANRPHTLLPDEVAHWAPLPDPEAANIGMSWITPAVREIQGDQLSTQHKIRFFENGATPNLVVKGLTAQTRQDFEDLVEMLDNRHAGIANAYKTLYLTAGADATVVGADMQQLDFKATQGAGETRIAFLSRVPAPLLGIAEGLAGSSLNAGNFGMARRIFADSWIYPSLQNLCSSLGALMQIPGGAELWFDTSDMPILREDAKDMADIQKIQASTITTYVKEGFTPESAIAAVIGDDPNQLEHTGLISVQLWDAHGAPIGGESPNGGSATPAQKPAVPGGAPPKALPATAPPPTTKTHASGVTPRPPK